VWSVSLKFRGPITAKLGPTLRIRQQSGCAKTGRWDLGGRWWGSDAARRRQARNLDAFIAWFVFWRSLQVTVRPMLRDRYPVCLLYINVAVLWPNGWMDQDATWYGGKPHPRRHCVRWEPSSPTEMGMAALPTFRPMSIVAKRSLISATAELLFYRTSTYSTALRIR